MEDSTGNPVLFRPVAFRKNLTLFCSNFQTKPALSYPALLLPLKALKISMIDTLDAIVLNC